MLYWPIRSGTCTPKIITCVCRYLNTSRCIATCHVLSPLWLATSCENHRHNEVSHQNGFRTVQVFYKFILTSVAESFFQILAVFLFSGRRRRAMGHLVTWVPQGVKSSSCYVCLSPTLQTFNETLIILISS